MIPTQYNLLIYRGILTNPGFYPNYLGDKSLPPNIYIRQFPETAKQKDYIYNQYSKDFILLIYPLSKLYYRELFISLQELQFYLEDVYYINILSNLKRSRLVGEKRDRPAKRKRASRRRLLRQIKEDLEYKFINKSNTFRN